MMWPSVDEGPPEVTLETSMGSFTVEVYTYIQFRSRTITIIYCIVSIFFDIW